MQKCRLFASLALLCLALIVPAQAHLQHWMLQARLTTAEWASLVQGEDKPAMKALLAQDFSIPGVEGTRNPPLGADGYLKTVGKYPITKVVTQHATFSQQDGKVIVEPVVIFPNRQFHTPYPLKLVLVPEGEAYKIQSVLPGSGLPPQVIDTKHPKTILRQVVPISLRDAYTDAPVRARVHIRGEDGIYWPPLFHVKNVPTGWREDVGGDVVIDGKTYAYVTPDFDAAVPPGKYVIEVERGIEYEPQSLTFEVTEDDVPALTIKLKRWTHMKAKGWYSGDTHVHFLDPHTALVEAQGEDLNVINVLGSSGGDLSTGVHQFTGAPSVLSTAENIVYMTEETRHDYLGHLVLLNLKKLIYPMGWGEPTTGVWGGIDYPSMAHQADKAHDQGATVVWAHFPNPNGELAIDMALGKIDAAEVFVFANPLEEKTRIGPLRTWYRLLNVGIDVPGLGATDKMWNTQRVGGVRTYVKIDEPFTYDSWVKSVVAGKTFFTTGPMIDFKVDGLEPGGRIASKKGQRVRYAATVAYREPVDKIEIVVDGKVVASKANKEGLTAFSMKGSLKVTGSSWIAARAYSSDTLPIQDNIFPVFAPVLGHTSPIYVDVDGAPRRSKEDAAFLMAWCDEAIAWAQTKAIYANDAQREEVVAIFKEARAYYAAQAQ